MKGFKFVAADLTTRDHTFSYLNALYGANLHGANLRGADLYGAIGAPK